MFKEEKVQEVELGYDASKEMDRRCSKREIVNPSQRGCDGVNAIHNNMQHSIRQDSEGKVQ